MYRLVLLCVLVPGLALAQPAPCENPPCADAAPPTESTPEPAPPAAPVAAPAEVAAPLTPAVEPEPPKETASEAPWRMRLGGYFQGQYRVRQNSPAPFDEDGFRLARVRLLPVAEGMVGSIEVAGIVEAELAPSFTLIDAFASFTRPLDKGGAVTLDAGQMRVPISRQQLLSDSRLSFVDKAQIATIAPDRDLGARVTYVPAGLRQVKVIGSAFNGEGKNQVQNINEGYLYAGRVELTPLGGPAPMQESSFVDPWVSLGLSAGLNKLSPGDYHEQRLYMGVDVSGSYKGLSGSFEYLEARYSFSGDAMKLPGPDYHANGFDAQVAYLVPTKLFAGSQVEVAARVEEIDRNDTVPIPQLGDPNQSVREYTGVVTWYLNKHLLKAQLAFSHFDEIEDKTSTMSDAAYDNDQVVLQITYRVE